MNPKRYTTAIFCFRADPMRFNREPLQMSDCSFTQRVFESLRKWCRLLRALFECCMAGAFETAAVSAHVLCTPNNDVNSVHSKTLT